MTIHLINCFLVAKIFLRFIVSLKTCLFSDSWFKLWNWSLWLALSSSSVTYFPFKLSLHRLLVILICAPFCCHLCLKKKKLSLHTKGQWNIQIWQISQQRESSKSNHLQSEFWVQVALKISWLIFIMFTLNVSVSSLSFWITFIIPFTLEEQWIRSRIFLKDPNISSW